MASRIVGLRALRICFMLALRGADVTSYQTRQPIYAVHSTLLQLHPEMVANLGGALAGK